ncbi:hypothetical protein SAMN05443292_0322 [Halpernia frigidisoli]|uniref:Uncharacterized protein n=2 Tax=Halpernia frigidisoli TaxID=1125876 RepID=A0A1I3D8P2_9FLAO|nr:hypothetical protein SAMN05443292_0322 [Halpernia frigidisoli]
MEDFNFKLDHCLQIIMGGFVVFQKYEETIYRKILITKHNTLIYVIKDDVIRIIQNFQDPEENYKDILREG